MGNCMTPQQRPDSPPLDVPDGIQRRGFGRSGKRRKIPRHASFSDEATSSDGVSAYSPIEEDGIEHHPKAAVRQQTSVQRRKTMKIKGFSPSETVELNKAENPWRPSSMMVKEVQNPEEAQEMYGRMRSILNKLTPEKFDQLMMQVKQLSINTEAQLGGISRMVFERAIRETKFVSIYAKMCHHLKDLTLITCEDLELSSNFVSFVLYLCRMEFYKVHSDGVALEREWQHQRARMEGGSQYLKELEAKVTAHRRRTVGSMKFLGELYKLEMVKDTSILWFITVFLNTLTEEALECMCCLITATGSILDSEKNKPQLDRNFSKIGRLLKRTKLTARVRCMLQDLIDLRLNNWVPSREEEGPKTTEEIRKEFELESQLEIEEELPEQLLSESRTFTPEVIKCAPTNQIPNSETQRVNHEITFCGVLVHKMAQTDWKSSIKEVSVQQDSKVHREPQGQALN